MRGAQIPSVEHLVSDLLMRVLIAGAAAVVSLGVMSAPWAHADPQCTYLGQNYPVHYDCLQNQPWLPYGTPGNPPLSGPPLGDCANPMNQHDQRCWRP